MGRSHAPKSAGPTRCLCDKPTTQTIRFGGRYISIMELSRVGSFDHGFLSVILSGKRYPSIPYAQRIADCLGMGLEDLLACIAQRKVELEEEFRRHIA